MEVSECLLSPFRAQLMHLNHVKDYHCTKHIHLRLIRQLFKCKWRSIEAQKLVLDWAPLWLLRLIMRSSIWYQVWIQCMIWRLSCSWCQATLINGIEAILIRGSSNIHMLPIQDCLPVYMARCPWLNTQIHSQKAKCTLDIAQCCVLPRSR